MDFGRSGCVFFLLFELKEEAGIAVAQESEIVGEGVIVDGAPVVIAHKGGDEVQILSCEYQYVPAPIPSSHAP